MSTKPTTFLKREKKPKRNRAEAALPLTSLPLPEWRQTDRENNVPARRRLLEQPETAVGNMYVAGCLGAALIAGDTWSYTCCLCSCYASGNSSLFARMILPELLNVLGCRLTYILRDKLRPMSEHGSVLLYVHGQTIMLVRTDSSGRPPRLSHSSWTMSEDDDCFFFLYIYIYSRLFSALEQTELLC